MVQLAQEEGETSGYEMRHHIWVDPWDLVDAEGVAMHREDLREMTQKKAERKQATTAIPTQSIRSGTTLWPSWPYAGE
jgi:hypothetical protein